MKVKLTEKENVIYEYIVDSLHRDGYAPSVRDIMYALEIKSTSTVHSYLNRLERKGYLHKEPGKSRTLRAENSSNPNRRTVKIPILGRVAAGLPLLAVENHEGYLDFPATDRSMFESELFGLRVTGESMIDIGILPDDIIVVRKESTANNGDIVVALVEDEATVKRFFKENGHYRLQPENKTMEPIIADEVFIIGRVISLLRNY